MDTPAADTLVRRRSPGRKRMIWLAVGVLSASALAIGILHLLPVGLGGGHSIIPYLFFSLDRGTHASPDSSVSVEIYSNDAGAMHSGTFWTWIVQRHWWGAKVVGKGYLEDSRGPVPLKWLDSRTVEVQFVKGRYDNTPAPQMIELD